MKQATAQQLKAMIVAFIFLSRVPMPTVENISSRDYSRSLPWFLLVGLTLGAALSTLGYFLAHGPAAVVAVLLVALNAGFTGGLHLDGLADSADAWLGGFDDRERTLEILKDPRCGSAAVITLIVVMMLQWAAFSELLQHQQWTALVLAPVVARAALLGIFMTTPYVRPQGLATDFLAHANRPLIIGLIFLVALLCSYLGYLPAISVLITALVVWLFRHLMLQRLGGCTGDTAGAMVEISSTCFCLAWVLNL